MALRFLTLASLAAFTQGVAVELTPSNLYAAEVRTQLLCQCQSVHVRDCLISLLSWRTQ